MTTELTFTHNSFYKKSDWGDLLTRVLSPLPTGSEVRTGLLDNGTVELSGLQSDELTSDVRASTFFDKNFRVQIKTSW